MGKLRRRVNFVEADLLFDFSQLCVLKLRCRVNFVETDLLFNFSPLCVLKLRRRVNFVETDLLADLQARYAEQVHWERRCSNLLW